MMIYLDGQFVPKKEAKISVFDHGFLYGDGVFEGIRAYDGVIFRLGEHLKRLYQSAKTVALQIPLSLEEMEKTVVETLRINNLHTAYIRLVVSRGFGDMGLDPKKCPKATVVVIASSIALYPDTVYENGMEVAVSSIRKARTDTFSARVKSLSYMPNIMAKIECNRQGLSEGILLNADGFVAEATAANIFVVKDGVLYTPHKNAGILEGITRSAIIDIADENEFLCVEDVLTVYDLYNADECFLTGTAAEIVPITKIDNRIIGDGMPGEITKNMIELFHERVEWDGTRI